MSIRHHPTDETLLRSAAGRLPPGPELVVATHLSLCPVCRERMAVFMAVGGVLIEELEPTGVGAECLDAALAAIAEDSVTSRPVRSSGPASTTSFRLPDGSEVPEPLRGCRFGPWRWMGLGIRISQITIPDSPDASLRLIRVKPRCALLDHGHVGTEFTQVISGSFTDRFGRFEPGDLAEVDTDLDHSPTADPDGECICLGALDGEMRLSGYWRILQPILRL